MRCLYALEVTMGKIDISKFGEEADRSRLSVTSTCDSIAIDDRAAEFCLTQCPGDFVESIKYQC